MFVYALEKLIRGRADDVPRYGCRLSHGDARR
jgi:hypothetical protein